MVDKLVFKLTKKICLLKIKLFDRTPENSGRIHYIERVYYYNKVPQIRRKYPRYGSSKYPGIPKITTRRGWSKKESRKENGKAEEEKDNRRQITRGQIKYYSNWRKSRKKIWLIENCTRQEISKLTKEINLIYRSSNK